jgi:hypothetical protein
VLRTRHVIPDVPQAVYPQPASPADSGPLARSAAVTPAARAAFRVIDARRLLEENP